jgi:hypothetical protein
MRTAIIVAVDSAYFTRTVSVDAILTALIVAVDAPYFTRTISVDAVYTAVIVAIEAPYFADFFSDGGIVPLVYFPLHLSSNAATVVQLYKTVLCF